MSIGSSPILRATATYTFIPIRSVIWCSTALRQTCERSSLVNGIQGDGSYHFNAYNTLRAGFFVSAEQTRAVNSSAVLPSSPDPTMFPVSPIDVFDETSKLGWLLGIYVQDEWKITRQLTLNAGLRFDQM